VERILVALDGSALAEAVLPVAAVLAREHEAELVLFRAVAPEPLPAVPDEEAEADGYLAGVARRLETMGVRRVRRLVVRAEADAGIVEAAERQRADLVAMTTHGRTGLSRLLVGSVADRVVRRAAAPVLLVRGEPQWPTGRTTEVLVPLDGSPLAEAILPAVERLAGPLDLAIHLFHAVEPTPAVPPEIVGGPELSAAHRAREAEQYLGAVAARLEDKGLRVRYAVRLGRAAEAIAAYVEEHGVGLVAMSTHGRTGLGRLLFGSVAERVLGAVKVPVVLWKARRP
jgi:nucleotide-binding universal stress UspA family protein